MFECKRILILSCCLYGSTASAAWLEGETQAPECQDALRHAEATYQSRASRLHAPDDISRDLQSDVVLGAIGVGGSREHDEFLRADPEHFDTLRLPMKWTRPLYWSRSLSGPVRIAVRVKSRGWRGETYSLYLLDGRTTPQSLYDPVNRAYTLGRATLAWQPPYMSRQMVTEPSLSPPVQTLIDGAWTAPSIFRHRGTHQLWIVDYGTTYLPLDTWTIHIDSVLGVRLACRIKFHRDAANTASQSPQAPRLTPHIHRLTQLLDLTLGSGLNEGSMQPTARLRHKAGHTWTNAIYRPWALHDNDRYNSRQEIDANLERWARKGPSFRNIHSDILATYPLARQELAAHYMTDFQLSGRDADKMAEWAMDIAYSSNFVFSNGSDYFRYEDANTNPWRSHRPKLPAP